MPTEKQMRRSGRGHIEEVVDSKKKVVITVWHGNKRVLMLSNYIRKDPVETCKKFDREGGSKIDVERPASVKIYNTFIGCVDKAHMFLSLYRPKYQSRKWYNQVMFHLCSLAVCNSWIIYQNLGGEKCLVDFLVEISISLMHGTSSTAFQSMMFAQKFIVQCGAQIFQEKCVMTNSITGPYRYPKFSNTSTAILKQNIYPQNMKFISVLEIIVALQRSME